ncbi:response regulator [Gloeocapsopsis crepidinum LEGE 06123]|uniref:Response regulator n=1 Tax=Gloeocapsopsis crepidinum LEGE 06123 TaxID=588587 RepID=A0ABR9UTD3_9CHRO|nr:response regulator [Gloeocapsopsis crepidinum]MBE9191524.1 response regulator [Gloeocapsopsis crepidinum LEGE 06123]
MVQLPVLNGNKQDTSNFGNTHPLQLEGIKVLVVDEMDNRELIMIILEQVEANVVTAVSAEKALQVLSRKDFDAVLCDIEMPNIDGYTLLRQLKSQLGKQITAIALTAYAGTINQQQASSAGFGQYLAKPIDPTTLVNAIINAVKR